MNGFFKTYYDLFQSIEESIEKRRIIPALILIYSAIESFSFLASTSDKNKREVFKEWVKRWMLTKYPLPCDEADLYSARCGLLHQQISQSNLSNKGVAKEIYYVWGNANLEALQSSIYSIDKCDSVVAVKVEDLMWSFRHGMGDCMNEVDKDKEWTKAFNEKAKKMFVSVNNEE